MVLGRRRRLRGALARPFPRPWRDLLSQGMVHWRALDAAERSRLEELARMLLVDKYWEATSGFSLTEEMRVLLAAMAAVPILGLDYDYYHGVTSLIVAPTVVELEGPRHIGDGLFTEEPEDIIGEARFEGPVLIAWDAAQEQALHPERGHNVVYHELAHKLDMLSGSVDGTPPLDSPAAFRRWVEVCTPEYERLRRGEGGILLDPYGGEDPGEFFAVASEVFFCRPVALRAEKPDLYSVLHDFYRQDPAAREARAATAPQGPPGPGPGPGPG